MDSSERLAEISFEEFYNLFPSTRQTKHRKPFDVAGKTIKVGVKYDKYVMIKNKGIACVSCGIVANKVCIETNCNKTAYINFYCNYGGKEILLTKDHIIPKSKGGKNSPSNYQPMCDCCNNKKGNTLE